jgi:hypothetical protein
MGIGWQELPVAKPDTLMGEPFEKEPSFPKLRRLNGEVRIEIRS